MADATTAHGILLPCPCCKEAEACVSLQLSDGEFFCRECEETFTADDVRQFIARVRRWEKLLEWAESMPTE
jgi:hypothetical protein